ncbi:MAG: chromate efflux transporter [Planctomycetota bacterium]
MKSDDVASAEDSETIVDRRVLFREEFCVWLRVALLSFGGPAAQIAVMHRIIVEEKKWLDERRFLSSLNFCMLLPGPEAQQLATYIGWLMHGVRGGLLAGLMFILPGFVSILLLSYLYVTLSGSGQFQAIFIGLKCAVLAVIVEAVIRVGKKVLHNRVLISLAIVTFLLLWLRILPFPAVIALAAVVGFVGHRISPEYFRPKSTVRTTHDSIAAAPVLTRPDTSIRRVLLVSAICLPLWFAPIVAAAKYFGSDSVFVESTVFFSKAAVVTFGGAYSVLSYVDEQAVNHFHWLEKGEMLDGLGLAETTPGPLIMVVQFVGFLAAFRHSEGMHPLIAGTLGALLTTWVTFVPCFYWIFLGAPFMERLLQKSWLSASLTAITASVVGVISTLGANMLLATLFQDVRQMQLAFVEFSYPVPSSLRLDALMVTTVAFLTLLRWHVSLPLTLVICMLLGCILQIVM